uniref:Glutamyl-tRNA(Gln) amidotransferase subunit A n=1 Tax=Schistocephalus solidus TaxID=70667 RepID=A0A0V0J5F8_SCHSO
MRRPGTIARLRRAILAKDLDPIEVWRFFAHRVDADRSAVSAGLPVSSLSLPATNAVVGDRLPDPPSLPSPADCQLFGIPFMVKDNFCVSTGQSTCASKALANFRAPYTAPVVESFLRAGGLLLGKTNMDEFAMGSASIHNQLTGPVVNPWSSPVQAARIAGGSSGGSAAAVAAGLTPAALASDTGGSCRLPAAFCGVTGYKPTFGLVSRCGLVPLANTLDSPSLIAPRVADIVDLLRAWMMVSCERGPIARLGDSTLSLPPGGRQALGNVQEALDNRAQSAENARLRIGIPWEFHTPDMSQEVAVVWDEVAGWLADEFNFGVTAVSLPHLPVATAVYSVLCAVEVASNMSRYSYLLFYMLLLARTDERNFWQSAFSSINCGFKLYVYWDLV